MSRKSEEGPARSNAFFAQRFEFFQLLSQLGSALFHHASGYFSRRRWRHGISIVADDVTRVGSLFSINVNPLSCRRTSAKNKSSLTKENLERGAWLGKFQRPSSLVLFSQRVPNNYYQFLYQSSMEERNLTHTRTHTHTHRQTHLNLVSFTRMIIKLLWSH